jgi:hypothetical protein
MGQRIAQLALGHPVVGCPVAAVGRFGRAGGAD